MAKEKDNALDLIAQIEVLLAELKAKVGLLGDQPPDEPPPH